MFEIPDIMSVGAFTLPLNLFILFAIGLAMLFLVRWICNKISFPYQEWQNVWMNGVIAYFFIWKFSFILLDPLSVVQQPSKILYATGGTVGHALALLGFIGVILFSLNKRSLPIYTFFDLLTVWVISTVTVFWVLNRTYGLPTAMPWGMAINDMIPQNEPAGHVTKYHPIFLYQFLLGSSLLLYMLQLRDKLGTGIVTIHSLFLFGTGSLVISLLIYQPASFLLGLSLNQWVYVAMSMLGLTGSLFFKPAHKKVMSSSNETL